MESNIKDIVEAIQVLTKIVIIFGASVSVLIILVGMNIAQSIRRHK